MMKAVGFSIAILVIAFAIHDAQAQRGQRRQGEGDRPHRGPPKHSHHGPRPCFVKNITSDDVLCESTCRNNFTTCTKMDEAKPGSEDLEIHVCKFQACNPGDDPTNCPSETTCVSVPLKGMMNETVHECRPTSHQGEPKGSEGSEGPGPRGGPRRRQGGRGSNRGPRQFESSEEDSMENEAGEGTNRSVDDDDEEDEDSCREVFRQLRRETRGDRPPKTGPSLEDRPPKTGEEEGDRRESNEPRMRRFGRRPRN